MSSAELKEITVRGLFHIAYNVFTNVQFVLKPKQLYKRARGNILSYHLAICYNLHFLTVRHCRQTFPKYVSTGNTVQTHI